MVGPCRTQWFYVIWIPLQLAAVLLMVALELGFWPALAGVLTMAAAIPLQVGLLVDDA